MTNRIFHKPLSRKKIILPVVFIMLMACTNENKWKGVWRGDVEVSPGFKAPFEFEISNETNGVATGRFEIVDIMASGSVSKVTRSDSTITLDFGDGATIVGTLLGDQKIIRALLNIPGEATDTIIFVRREQFISKAPARVDQDGKPVMSWQYTQPEKDNDGWHVASLDERLVRGNALDSALQNLVGANEFHGVDALLIARDGKVVLEEYFHIGSKVRPHSIQSDTKSVMSLLFGIALQESKLSSLDEPIEKFFPQYLDTMKRSPWGVSVRDALMMSASLDWKENIPYSDPSNDAVRMNNSKDMYHFVLSHNRNTDEQPGTKFAYNSGLSVLLGGVLWQATGLSADEYAKETLFKSLDIQNYHWLSFRGQTHTGGGLNLRPRDLLKIGQMVLDSGQWKNQQVVPKSWIKESTTYRLGTSDSNPKEGYGYQWWLGEFNVKGVSHPYIFASGFGGQFLWVVPDLKLVIVSLSHIPTIQKGRAIISPKEVEEIILPSLLK